MSDTFDTRHWKRLDALLEIALSLPPEERDRWVETLPAEDAPLGPTLRQMLSRAGIETDTFMDRPVGAETLDAAAGPREDRPGDGVAGYRLVSVLGTGGMATVWAAERQDGSVQRRIALKLPRAGWSPGLSERLKRECAILSTLEHPHIARLYDAGVTGEGRPYLAMELIEGVPIDTYCSRHALPVRARLDLFLQVARAIAFAHARLVVHRDLKPSNILVDAAGTVHVVDFGLAKVLDEGVDPRPHLTEAVGRHLTPAYASPEQIRGEPLTVATDVYSLGVVLYGLLTGKRPYEVKRDTPAALEEAIAEADVPPASSRVEARALKGALRGDLDTILAKALRKAPLERYATMEAFAADVERHLRAEPVLARPDSVLYVAGRFVRRHRVAVTAAALVGVATILGLGGTLYQARLAAEQARRAEVERDKALRELNFAEATEEFMRYLLSEQASRPLPAAVLLQRAEKAISEQYSYHPSVQARLHIIVGQLYAQLSEYARTEAQFREGRRLALVAGDADTAAYADCALGGLMMPQAKHKEAFALVDATIARLESEPDTGGVAREYCYQQRAAMNRQAGRAEAAAADAAAALRAMGKPRPGQEQNRAFLRLYQAYPLIKSGRFGEALANFDQSRQDMARIGRTNTSSGVYITSNYFSLLVHAGQIKRAEAVYKEAVRGLANDSSGLLGTLQMNNLSLLLWAGRNAEALALGQELAAARSAKGDKQGEGYARLWSAIAACNDGKVAQCESLLARAEENLQPVLTPTHPTTSILDTANAQLLLAKGETAKAAERLEAAVARMAGERSPYLMRALSWLAIAQQAAGNAAAARDSAARAVEVARSAMSGLTQSEWLGSALRVQGRILEQQGEAAAAAPVLREAREQLVGSIGEEAAARVH